jgi:hypothetical protein
MVSPADCVGSTGPWRPMTPKRGTTMYDILCSQQCLFFRRCDCATGRASIVRPHPESCSREALRHFVTAPSLELNWQENAYSEYGEAYESHIRSEAR